MTNSMATASSMQPKPAVSSKEIPDTGPANSRFGIRNFGCEKTPFMGVFLYLVAQLNSLEEYYFRLQANVYQ